MTRLLEFENILNFRDFGDYATKSGAHIKPRHLFRSAHLASASEEDLKQIEALNIGLVSDLRHKPERARQPNRWPDKPRRTLEFPDRPEAAGDKMAPHEAFTKHTLQEAHQADAYMKNSYENRPSDPAFQSIFADTLIHMAETGDPILIHCAAGKDRTGTLAAIILSALNVAKDTIMEDYMLTMQAVDIENYLGQAAPMMSKKYERGLSIDALRPLFIVNPQYLEKSLNTIGDMDDYIHKTLGITDTQREAIHNQYLT